MNVPRGGAQYCSVLSARGTMYERAYLAPITTNEEADNNVDGITLCHAYGTFDVNVQDLGSGNSIGSSAPNVNAGVEVQVYIGQCEMCNCCGRIV